MPEMFRRYEQVAARQRNHDKARRRTRHVLPDKEVEQYLDYFATLPPERQQRDLLYTLLWVVETIRQSVTA